MGRNSGDQDGRRPGWGRRMLVAGLAAATLSITAAAPAMAFPTGPCRSGTATR